MKNTSEFHHNTGEDGAATAEYAIATMVAVLLVTHAGHR
jgi:Flp pilus assembly pilin Flp